MTDNVIPINATRRPIGNFHAVGCREGASLECHGHAYYDPNHLDTSDGRPLCEVRFADGMWLLADPTQDLVPGSSSTTTPGASTWPTRTARPGTAGRPQSSSAASCNKLLDALDEPHRWDGADVWVGDDETPFAPREDGLYDTQFLGWTFRQVDP